MGAGPSRLRRAVWLLSMGCTGVQVLLSVAMLWTMMELSTYGDVARRPTYSWVGLVLPLVTAAGAWSAASAAWRCRWNSGALARLVASHGVVLVTAVIMLVALRRATPAGSASALLLQPGSRLPPNEIYGSEAALGMIIAPLVLAGALAVPGLLLSVLLGVADRRARRE